MQPLVLPSLTLADREKERDCAFGSAYIEVDVFKRIGGTTLRRPRPHSRQKRSGGGRGHTRDRRGLGQTVTNESLGAKWLRTNVRSLAECDL